MILDLNFHKGITGSLISFEQPKISTSRHEIIGLIYCNEDLVIAFLHLIVLPSAISYLDDILFLGLDGKLLLQVGYLLLQFCYLFLIVLRLLHLIIILNSSKTPDFTHGSYYTRMG